MVNGIKSLKNDETGIAYGLFGAFVLIIMGGALYIYFSPIINGIVNAFNNYVNVGLVADATRNAFAFGVTVWGFLILVIAFGIFGFIVVKAHEQRDY